MTYLVNCSLLTGTWLVQADSSSKAIDAWVVYMKPWLSTLEELPINFDLEVYVKLLDFNNEIKVVPI